MTYFFSHINRYILGQFFKWFAICLAGLAAIVALFEVIELLRKLMTRPMLSFSSIIEILILKTPSHLQLMLPFIVLAASMLTFSRLNQSSELTVIKSFGISIWKMLGGLTIGIFFLGIANLSIWNPLQTVLTQRLYFLEGQFFGTKRNILSINESGLWLKEGKEENNRIMHASHANLEKGIFSDVTIYSFDNTGILIERTDAKMATLKKGYWQLYDANRFKQSHHEPISESIFPTELNLQKIKDSNALPETLSFWDIPAYVSLLKNSGMSPLPYTLYYYKLIARVGLMIVMVFLAAGFCTHPIRSRNLGGLIAICLLTGLVFHFLTDFIYALGLGGRIPPLFAVFLPPLIGLFASLFFLLYHEEYLRKG